MSGPQTSAPRGPGGGALAGGEVVAPRHHEPDASAPPTGLAEAAAPSASRTGPSAPAQPGTPSAGPPSCQPLAGRCILLPRLREPDALADELESAGARVVRAALTRTVPGDTAALAELARLAASGQADWLVLTSARTVWALTPHLRAAEAGPGRLPLRVAVVGPATARAWVEETGTAPDLVAAGSAAALAGHPELARGTGRLLLPASALADPALARALGESGWEVVRAAAYSTAAVGHDDLPPGLERAWRQEVEAAVLTAPSTTRALLDLLGPPRGARLIAIGATTARAATAMGLPVAATAGAPTPAGVREAVLRALGFPVATVDQGPQQGPQPA
ncbi:uroporphyrinogen-III synthase [Actinomyces slackii]|uniref:Uroporphyrinogen-III synthase n=1 Tax=Actinomyces slackii TaxID=52774 RepID=A0A448KA63_9ACTO|nr:uroporphyrinogen-III synthase [Actinomyces slackii]VEG73817.1 uroporphyrinogen-III synthase [Actinomyces slackii]